MKANEPPVLMAPLHREVRQVVLLRLEEVDQTLASAKRTRVLAGI